MTDRDHHVPETSPGHTNTVGALRHCANLLEQIEREPDAISEAECEARVVFVIETLQAVHLTLTAVLHDAPPTGGRR